MPSRGSTNTTYKESLESEDKKNTTYRGIGDCYTKESLSFIWKTYKTSGIRLHKRTWDIVLDLIVLSFNCSRPKWRLRSPMVEGNMGRFESKIGLF